MVASQCQTTGLTATQQAGLSHVTSRAHQEHQLTHVGIRSLQLHDIQQEIICERRLGQNGTFTRNNRNICPNVHSWQSVLLLGCLSSTYTL